MTKSFQVNYLLNFDINYVKFIFLANRENRNKHFFELTDDPEIQDILSLRKPGVYTPVAEDRVSRLKDLNGQTVAFEELVNNGMPTGLVRCRNTRCQNSMWRKIKKQVKL